MVAMVLTGMWITIGVLVCDILACTFVLNGYHEYSNDIQGTSINLHIVFATLACDLIFVLPILLSILYICICYNWRGAFKRAGCNVTFSSHSRLLTCVAFLVGKNTINKISRLTENEIVSIMFPVMLITPVLCVSSHLGYIMLAWLTEPSKCTTTLVLYYTFLVCLFFSFRKCYHAHSGIRFTINWSRKDDVDSNGGTSKSVEENEGKGMELEVIEDAQCAKVEHATEEVLPSSDSCCCIAFGQANKKHINIQAFSLLLLYGTFIVGIAAMVVLIFLLLPFASQELVMYLFHVIQLLVVLLSIRFTYNLFFSNTFSFETIVQKFKEVYAKRGHNKVLASIAQQEHEELADVAGEFAAEFTDVMINKASTHKKIA